MQMRERVNFRLVNSAVLAALAAEEARLSAAASGAGAAGVDKADERGIEPPVMHEGYEEHAVAMAALRLTRHKRLRGTQRLCLGVLPFTLPLCAVAYLLAVCYYSAAGIINDPREPLVYKIPFTLAALLTPIVTLWGTLVVYCVRELPVLETQPAWPAVALGSLVVKSFALAVAAVGGWFALVCLIVGYIVALLVNLWLDASATGIYVTAVWVTLLVCCCPCASFVWYFRNEFYERSVMKAHDAAVNGRSTASAVCARSSAAVVPVVADALPGPDA